MLFHIHGLCRYTRERQASEEKIRAERAAMMEMMQRERMQMEERMAIERGELEGKLAKKGVGLGRTAVQLLAVVFTSSQDAANP